MQVRQFSPRSGMSLVEVGVAMGVSMVAFMGLLDMMRVSQKGQKNVQTSIDITNYIAQLRLTFNDPNSCEKVFYNSGAVTVNFTPGGTTNQVTLLIDGQPVTVGTPVAGSFQISQLDIQDKSGGAVTTVTKGGTTYNQYLADLIVGTTKTGDVSGNKILGRVLNLAECV